MPALLHPQSSQHVILRKPQRFYANDETVETNSFQTRPLDAGAESVEAITQKMSQEYASMVALLVENKIRVTQLSAQPDSPDSIFPNNVFSTHADGRAVLYPMQAPNRDHEITPELEAFLHENYSQVQSYRDHRQQGQYLEGTGSLVLDRVNKIAYAALSPRTCLTLAQIWAQDMGYQLVSFRAYDQGVALYHTNLMMFVGTNVSALCLECIAEEDQAMVLKSLARFQKDVVLLSLSQLRHMCGNVLEVRNAAGDPLLVMSDRAYHAFEPEQIDIFEQHYRQVIHTNIETIETYGGGSARCMLAEVF